MQGPDPADPAQSPRPVEPTRGLIEEGAAELRIARLGGYFARGGEPAAFETVERVAGALGAGREVVLPGAEIARAAAYLITMTEGAALHLERLRTRARDFDPDVRDRLIAGAMLPGVWAAQAQKYRRMFHEEALKLFREVDALIAPATPCRAPAIGKKTFVLDGREQLVRPNIGVYTQPISFIGLPVVAAPVWTAGERLPIGVQIIAPPWREDLALRVARQLERDGVAAAPAAGT
jgi:aspartyl-tRNA(Asn)/glutamyl-tRNA(Gln) amidotransferase subunit A